MKHTMKLAIPVALISLAFALVGIFGFRVFSSAAVGVSPAEIIVDNVKIGTSVKQYVSISRQGTDGSETYIVSALGQAANRISFPQGKKVTLQSGKQEARLPIVIQSKGLGEGDYEAELQINQVKSADVDQEGGVSAVLQGFTVPVRFSVTQKIAASYRILNAGIAQLDYNVPVEFFYTLQNDGQKKVRPKRIVFEARDVTSGEVVHKETFRQDTLDGVAAGKQKQSFVETGLKAGIGEYEIVLKFFSDKKLVFQQDIEQVSVRSFSGQDLPYIKDFTSDKDVYSQNEIILFMGVIENPLDRRVTARLKVDLLKEGEIVKTLESEEVDVPVLESREVSLPWATDAVGDYTARAYFIYENDETNVKELTLRVERDISYAGVGGGIGLLVVVIGGILLIAYFRNRNREF